MATRPSGLLKVFVRHEDNSVSMEEIKVPMYMNEKYDEVLKGAVERISKDGLIINRLNRNTYYPPHMITSMTWEDEAQKQ